MAFSTMAFDPTDGLANETSYPTTPASETAARAQIQAPLDQLKTGLNGLITELEGIDAGTSGADYIGSAEIDGVTGTTVHDQIDDLKTQIDAVTAGAVSDGSITTAKLGIDCVTSAKISDDAVDSEHIVDGSIDTAHLSAGCVTSEKIADDQINSEHYVAGSIDEEHLSSACVTEGKIGTAAVTTAKIYDAAITAAKMHPDVVRLVASNVGVGTNANAGVTTGNGNTAIGYNANAAVASGYFNTALGYGALSTTAYQNTSGVGYNATVTGNNQVQLGESSTTTYAYGAVQNRSDERDKADIKDTELGLGFIMALKPRQFKWDYREDYDGKKDGSKKRTREHQGFIAQEVKEVMDAQGIDFAGYQDHSVGGGKDVLSLGYVEFIAPLVKAIQDQQKIIDELRKKVGV